MKRLVKVVCFCAASLFFLTAASLLRGMCFIFSFPPNSIMTNTARVWAKVMNAIMDISVMVEGENKPSEQHAALIVSNHLSYLDIVIIASVLPTLFVAKKEVRHWPMLGWLARLGGTIFVDRSLFRGGIAAATEIVRTLQSNVRVHIFPEGTSSSGERVLPFKPSLFAAALEAHVPIQPVTIQYFKINGEPFSDGNRDTVCWYGNMKFVEHFFRFLNCKKISASVTIHPLIIPSPYSTPQSLAIQSHATVVSAHRTKSATLLQEEVV